MLNQSSAIYACKNKEMQSFWGFFQLFNNKRYQLNFLASISSETKYKTVKKLYVEILFDYSVRQSNQINWATINICVIK